MSKSQRVWFKAGCWAALATAGLHLVGHMQGPPPPATGIEPQLTTVFQTYRFALPGGSARTLSELMAGFSLVFAASMAMFGGLNLAVVRRSAGDDLLIAMLIRLDLAFCVTILAISLTYFFIIPTILIAVVTVCFAGALVGGRAAPQA